MPTSACSNLQIEWTRFSQSKKASSRWAAARGSPWKPSIGRCETSMDYQVVVEPRARSDVDEIFSYIARDAPLAAHRWYEALSTRMASLGFLPSRFQGSWNPCSGGRMCDRWSPGSTLSSSRSVRTPCPSTSTTCVTACAGLPRPKSSCGMLQYFNEQRVHCRCSSA